MSPPRPDVARRALGHPCDWGEELPTCDICERRRNRPTHSCQARKGERERGGTEKRLTENWKGRTNTESERKRGRGSAHATQRERGGDEMASAPIGDGNFCRSPLSPPLLSPTNKMWLLRKQGQTGSEPTVYPPDDTPETKETRKKAEN